MPAKTLAEFVAYVKANPGKLTFGSGGIGTPAHLAGELLKVEANIEMTHAPFRGTGQALQSVIGGHVPVASIRRRRCCRIWKAARCVPSR